MSISSDLMFKYSKFKDKSLLDNRCKASDCQLCIFYRFNDISCLHRSFCASVLELLDIINRNDYIDTVFSEIE